MGCNKIRVMLIRDGKIAIIESKRSNLLMLPGGRLEKDENSFDGLKRMIKDELGIDIEIENIKLFFTKKSEYIGKEKSEIATTEFYIAQTEKDIDFEKMNLTEREKKRGVLPYWINPAKLEYILSEQREKYSNSLARKYADEYLTVYHRFLEFQRKENKEERKSR